MTKDGQYSVPGQAETHIRVILVDSAARLFSTEEHWTDGTLISKGFVSGNSFSSKTGLHTFYYKNGNKRSEGLYFTDNVKRIIGMQSGMWTYWYENGKKNKELYYTPSEKEKYPQEDILNYWDTTGMQKVKDGNGDYFEIQTQKEFDDVEKICISGKVKNKKPDGTWTGIFTDGKPYCTELYENGTLVKGESLDRAGNKYSYTKVLIYPEFAGGDMGLIKFLQRTIQYPQFERDYDVQGKVILRFIIDEKGKVTYPRIIRSVSPGLDKESLRVIKILPDFSPAMLRGKPVRVPYNLPVVYKLQ
jgi:TonB family protein